MDGVSVKMSKKVIISSQQITNICLLFYLCAASAHQTGVGIDSILIRVSLLLYGGVSFLVGINSGKLRVSQHTLWLMLFLGYYYLSFIWSSDSSYLTRYTNTFIQLFVVTFFIINNTKTKDDIADVLNLVVISMLYTVVMLLIRTPTVDFGTERIGSALGLHSNGVGYRMSMCVVISLYFIKVSASIRKRLFYSVCIASFVIIALLTGSKKSLIIIALGILFFSIMTTSGTAKRVSIALLLTAILFAVFIIIMNNPYLYQVLGRRVENFFSTLGGKGYDRSTLERLMLMQFARDLFMNNMLIGYGGNNFVAYVAEIGYGNVVYSHNNYWELLSTLGIVGFVIYYGHLFILGAYSFKLWLKVKFDPLVSLSFITLVITAITDYAMISYQNEFMHILIAVIFLICAMRKSEIRDIAEEEQHNDC